MTPSPLSDEQILAEMRRQIWRAYIAGLGHNPWHVWFKGVAMGMVLAAVGILIGWTIARLVG